MTSPNSLVRKILDEFPMSDGIEKTREMEDLEWEYIDEATRKPKDIRILMLEALSTQPTQRDAANSLDLFPPTFSHWLRKLGISVEALATQPTQRDAANSLDLFPPTFSHWLRKLGISGQARKIREIKRAEKLRTA